ncbi:MAG: hypothetical protein H7177_03235 [Rhizobacter sp.]|nr:hypothetical protein [Bacteriovorax sp.]
MKLNFKTFLILFICCSCSTMKHKDFTALVENGKCEEALKNVPDSSISNFIKQTKRVSGAAASYALTGITYGGEVTFVVVGGIVVGLAICSPLIAAETAAKGSGNISGECFVAAEKVLNKHSDGTKEFYGKKIFDKTSNWRCPDLSDFSQNLREVATCYENKKDYTSLEKAVEQLDIIRNTEFQEECVDDSERTEITKQYSNIMLKLKPLRVLREPINY